LQAIAGSRGSDRLVVTYNGTQHVTSRLSAPSWMIFFSYLIVEIKYLIRKVSKKEKCWWLKLIDIIFHSKVMTVRSRNKVQNFSLLWLKLYKNE
jgi:hypothetical protein